MKMRRSVGSGDEKDEAEDVAPRGANGSLGTRILTLLFLVRSSGSAQYRQELGLAESEVRLLGALGRRGPLSSSHLAQASGMFLSHTSRATTELSSIGLLRREHLRAPFELTDEGRALTDRLLQLADERQKRLVDGLSGDDRQFMAQTIDRLLRLGERWLAEELTLHSGGDTAEEMPDDIVAGGLTPDPLVPSLGALSMVMGRSAFLAWRRTTGIKAFEWVVLSRVAEAGRIRLTKLAYLTARDKSQVWRTAARLVEAGLLVRHNPKNSRELELTVTEEGASIYDETAKFSAARNQRILRALGPKAAERFAALVERMITNAQSLMRRSDEH